MRKVAALALITCVVVLLPLAEGANSNLSLSMFNEFGPLTDIGDTHATIAIYSVGGVVGGYFPCETKPSVTRSGSDLVVVATLLEGEPLPYAACQFATTGVFGALSAGDYSVRALIALPDGTTATLQQSISVEARGVRCNPDPFHNQVGVTLKSNDLLSFERRLDQDAAYRASLGNVAFASAGTRVQLAFPELQDPIRIMDLLKQSGDFVNIAGLGFGCFTTPPGSATVVTIEYRNTVTDRYFYTPDAAEQIAIDTGKEGAGWSRTGLSFTVTTHPGCPTVSSYQHPVYRFVGAPGRGPDSHFFTISESECAIVRDRTAWAWMFEGAPFWAAVPNDGQCGFGASLYRLYNNGIGGVPNHRYTTDALIVNQMTAAGWTNEGVVMCVLRNQ